MASIRYTEAEVAEYLARIRRGKVDSKAGNTSGAADMERDIIAAVTKEDPVENVRPRYRIHVCARRKRLTDPDALCIKWVIDGLVKAKIIPDDSAKYVREVSYTQEKSKIEETEIEVWEITDVE